MANLTPMTVIAYYALRWLEDAHERELNALRYTPLAPMIHVDTTRITALRGGLANIKEQAKSPLYSLCSMLSILQKWCSRPTTRGRNDHHRQKFRRSR